MSITAKFLNNTQNIEIVDEVFSLLSEKMNVDKTEAWKVISDKSVDELRKSVRKQKKKRAKTAYTMFSKDVEVTNDLKKKHGENVSIGEMSKLKSALWKTLSDKDKEKYEQMAKDENEANPVVNHKPEKKPKAKTAYNMFLADKELRDSITKKSKSKMSMKEVNEEMIKIWKALSDKDMNKYKELAKNENDNLNKDEEVVNEVDEKKEVVNEVDEKKEVVTEEVVNEVDEKKEVKKSPAKKKSPGAKKKSPAVKK